MGLRIPPLTQLSLHRNPSSLHPSIFGLYLALLVANLLAWTWAFFVFHTYPLLLGAAFLAYSFGLRHAVDVDHIAAIDNITRKLMQQGKRPIGVGFFFALGHSSVVVLVSLVLVLTAGSFAQDFAAWQTVGGVIGTSVSGLFLLFLALMNLLVLISTYRTFQKVKSSGIYEEEDLALQLSRGGPLSRLCQRLFGLINHSWQMVPLGFLFGLGFDTSTEVGLLGLSTTQAIHGLPFWTIMVFPVLFTVAMTLVDTTDGVLMLGAYQWAFLTPRRKLYYNMTMTGLSVVVALLVGGIEVLGLLGDQLSLSGVFWNILDQLNEHFGMLGWMVIGLFLACWLVSFLLYRWQGDAPLKPDMEST